MTDAERLDGNKRLGTLLGWTAKELPHKNGGGTYWILVNPDGKCVYSFGSGGGTGEAQVWRHAPDFFGSVDAVLAELPADMHLQIIAEAADRFWCELWHDGEPHPGVCAGGATRAEAAASALEAYLAR